MIALIVVIAIIVVVALAGVASYNRFVSQRNAVQNAWADIDTELKRRYDLIPNLVSTVQGYAAHERGVFEEVAQARSVGLQAQGPAAASAAEGPFQMALGHLFAVAENYPELKANQNFLQLQATLSATPKTASRPPGRSTTPTSSSSTRRVQSFPSNVIANMFHFQNAEFFQIDTGAACGGRRSTEGRFQRDHQRDLRSGARPPRRRLPEHHSGAPRDRTSPAPAASEARRCSRRRAAGG